VQRAQRLAEADDIGPRILKVATGFARWVDVKPAMFSDLSDEELAKYDKFISGIEEGRSKQEGILQDIKVR
jgi:programmed cell death 6-interacting protein